MIRSILIRQNQPISTFDVFKDTLPNDGHDASFVWISLENTNNEEMNRVLADVFHFHPLAIEDCQSCGYQTPKVDDYEDYLFIIAHAIPKNHNMIEGEPLELNIFLGENYLVTNYTDEEMPAVQKVWQRLERDKRLQIHGADFLCHGILDTLVDDYLPEIDQMEDEISLLEDLVISQPKPSTLERILNLKHSVMSLRRIITPLREVVNRLSRDEFPQVDLHSRIYFRDIYDHLVRIHDLSESIRDIASGALDIYLNSTSLRLNVVMKALTIVSTIFLPLTFLAGIYGMNFHYMPELEWLFGYPMVWGLCLMIATGMMIFFKKKKWW